MRLVQVINADRSTVLGDRIQVADTSLTRLFGLLGKRGLDAGNGLWIKPSSGVHTLGMLFSIDVVGLDKHMRVTKLWNNLVPFRITSVSTRLKSVIELPAGTIAQCEVQLGHVLHIV